MTRFSDRSATPGRAAGAHDAAALVFDRDAVREVDRRAIADFGIPGIVLMENAARALADQAMRMLAHCAPPRRVLIVCGSGNNGGDGYALARHLHNRGVEDVRIAALGSPDPRSDAGVNRAICMRMDLPVREVSSLMDASDSPLADLIVDALLGTGLDRPVSGEAKAVIEWINRSMCPVLAVDVPSGMDCDSGLPLGACVRAAATVTFVGVKKGFLVESAKPWLGEVIVGDIGAPREIIERCGRLMPTDRT